mgnify:CR=1 FL=1
MDKGIERRTTVNVDGLKHSKNDEKIENSLCYNISLNPRFGIS